MQLLLASTLRARLGLPDLDTITATLEAAVEDATTYIENDMRTTLTRADYSDLWLMSHDDYKLNSLRLKLTAGFVLAGSVEAGTGPTADAAREDNSLTDTIIVRLESGLVSITDLNLQRFISVRYTAGFGSDAQEPKLFNLAEIPDWLKTAAALKATYLMSSSADFDAKDGDVVDGKDYQKQYTSIITPRVRYAPMARAPIL